MAVFIQIVRWAVIGLWSIWVIYYFGISAIVRPQTKSDRGKRGGQVISIFIGIALICFFIAMMTCAFCEAATNPGIAGIIGMAIGIPVMVTGMTGMILVRERYLKKQWRLDICIEKNMVPVNRGPYRIVRHPIYAFGLLVYFGAALAFLELSVFIASGLVMAGYVTLALREDQLLSRWAKNYGAYKKKTRALLVPWIFKIGQSGAVFPAPEEKI